MADEPTCVCGHKESEHGHRADGSIDFCFVKECDCRRYRPSLPWPDAEGNWWCSQFTQVVYATRRDGELVLGYEGADDWFPRKDFEMLFGRQRFARLLEQNPYEGKSNG